jgi:hypothetical protein
MKKSILLPCFLLGGLSLMAQTRHQQHHPLSTGAQKNHKLIGGILAKQVAIASTANKPTTIKQRVIGQASIDLDGQRLDSMKYKYSGTRTSSYNFNGIDFDNNTAFLYNNSFSSDYLPSYLTAITPTNSNLQADSIFYYEEDSVRQISKAFYAADNKVDSFSSYSMNYPTLKIKHIYNAQGALIQATNMDNAQSAPAFDTNEISKYFYNTAGTQLTTDTTYDFSNGSWEPSLANVYHYNSLTNLLDTINSYSLDDTAWYLSGVSALQYTSNGHITHANYYGYDPTETLYFVETDTLGYNGAGPYFSYYNRARIFLDNGSSVDGVTIYKTFGSNNLPDSARVGFFDETGLYQDVSLKYTYNTYNNPVTLIGTDPADTSYAGQFNFYYETFDDTPTPPPSAINDIKNNKDFSIYPNPFDNKLNIDWKGAKANQTKIALVNVLGQTVYSSNQNLITGANTIDIPNLIKGNYVLLIQDAKGNTWKSQLVKN